MSLLNDMLRDLDARRSRPADLGTLTLQGVAPALPRTAPAWPLGKLALGLALAVGLAATAVYFGYPRPALVPAIPAAGISMPAASSLAASRPATVEDEVPAAPATRPATEPQSHVPAAPAVTASAVPMAETRTEPEPIQPVRAVTAPNPETRPAVAARAQAGTGTQTRVRALSAHEQAQQVFEQGAAALRQDQPRRAENLWREALALQPEHQPARLALAGLQARQQRSEEALALLAAGLALEPRSVELARLRGHLLLQQDRLEEARRVLEAAAPAARQQADYLALLGTLYQRLGQHGQAVVHYRQALGLQPDQGLWWMGLGVSLDQSQQGDAAREAFRTALGYGLSPALQQYIRGRLAALANQDG